MSFELHEKCAVAGIILHGPDHDAAAFVYESLFAMQHRGAEASGIVSESADGAIRHRRGLGMVVDVYSPQDIAELASNIAIGHNRYSTSGAKDRHAQPVVDEAIGLSLSVNGNLPSTRKLESFLAEHRIPTVNRNDVELMGLAIGKYISTGMTLESAITKAYPLFTGAFSAVAVHAGKLVAFRDPYGIRPLAFGKLKHGYAVTSETCGLDIIDADYVREVEPGEMLIITSEHIESHQLAPGKHKLDMFEFVYFARPDSRLYGLRVNEVRRRFGEQLAKEYPVSSVERDNVVVVPVPDTAFPAAEGYADALGIRHIQAIIKNRYTGRTFMQPTHDKRHEHLRRKHNMVPEAVRGRDVILIDDSIVRLNTMPRLVELAVACGARSVSVLVACPPVRFPDFYGIDTPAQSELVAARLTVEQMRQKLGDCRQLGFLSLDGMVAATGLPAAMFNLSCFTGEYPIDIGEHRSKIKQPVSMQYVQTIVAGD